MMLAAKAEEGALEKQDQVRQFWDAKPCDSELSEQPLHSKAFYQEIERARYRLQPHILEILGWVNWQSKQVLEIGTGVGTDARQIAQRGGFYYGINVDQGSTEVTAHCEIHAQSYHIRTIPGTNPL